VSIDDIDRIKNILSSTVGLVTVSHVTDSDGDVEGGERLLGGGDLSGEGAGGEDAIEQGLGPELNGTGDIWSFRVGLDGVEERVPASLPLVAAVESEPDQGVYAYTSIPSSVDDIVVEALVIASTVETNVTALETSADVLEVGLELGSALASCHFIAEAEEGILGVLVAPPVVETAWWRVGHIKVQGWEAAAG